MKWTLKILFTIPLSVLIIGSGSVFAFTDIVSSEKIDISSECKVLEDEKNEYSVKNIIKLTKSSSQVFFNTESKYNSDFTYWASCILTNKTRQEEWILRLPFQSITHGEVYVVDSLDNYQDPIKIGIFERRGINDGWLSIGKKFNLANVSFKKGGQFQLLIKARNSKDNLPVEFKIELIPADRNFYDNQIMFTTFLSGFAGALILLAFIVIVLSLVTKDKSYSKYAFYLISLVIWMTFANGILRNWCIDSLPDLDPKYIFLLRSIGILTLTFYIQFIWNFGNLSFHFPSLKKYYNVINLLIFLLFFTDLIVLITSNFNFVWSNFVSGIALVLTTTFCLILLNKLIKNRHIPFFKIIIAGIAVIFITPIFIFVRVYLNDFKSIDAYEVFIGQALDIAIFTFGIALKYRDHLKVSAENVVIKNLLSEKDTLIREIHHRVKNNLQVISSLLNIQRRRTTDQGAKDALKEGQNRVQSMFLIHKDLYQQENVTSINMKNYFDRISRNLFDTYNISADKIQLVTEIDDINLDVDTVVPLGLIINELISNALKYAFPEDRKGSIFILLQERMGKLHLSVSDDGVGINNISDLSKSNSFGYNLINAFAKKLDAELNIQAKNGTNVEIVIKNYQKAS